MTQIVDAFPLNDELDVLRARLELLPQVTRVLVAEGSHTHQGKPKRLHLDGVDLPERVERIRCDLSGHKLDDEGNWIREGLQREYLLLRLENLADTRELPPDALVLSCDADELVNPLAIPRILEATEWGPAILHLRMIYYGRWEYTPGWFHAKAFRLRDLPDRLTGLRTTWDLPRVEEAGWHVSYRGGEDQLRRKVESFAHGENREPGTWERIRRGREIGLGPNGEELVPLRDAGQLPEPVRQLL